MRRSRVLRDRLRSRVVVTMKTGAAFGGILFDADHAALVLRETLALGAGQRQSDVPLDGEWVGLWSEVAYVQRP